MEVKVNPIEMIGGKDTRPAKGHKLFQELYPNIFLLAKKKSGKTTVLNTILRKCTDPTTRLIFIVSTAYKDDAYKSMIQQYEARGHELEVYTALKEDGIDILKEEIKRDPKTDDTHIDAPRDDLDDGFLMFDRQPTAVPTSFAQEPVIKRTKYATPEVVYVLDDLGSSMRSPSVYNLLKLNRHLKSMVIISSQYLHDLQPASISQLDYMLIFKGQPLEKLKRAHQLMDLSTEFNIFHKYYDYATQEKYSFLYIDINNDCFKRRFSHRCLKVQ